MLFREYGLASDNMPYPGISICISGKVPLKHEGREMLTNNNSTSMAVTSFVLFPSWVYLVQSPVLFSSIGR